MPQSSFTNKDGMPLKNPYQILGIPVTASESDIKRAFRQLSLKLHPDKQSGSLTSSQREDLDRKFHDIKDARSFLLDIEHAAHRKKYDDNLASERVRHAEEERRERTMSARRKRMRDELSMRESMAAKASVSSSPPSAPSASSQQADRFDIDRLRREGERLREEYSKREAEVNVARQQRVAFERASQKLAREDRQVRLKWSRKKVVGGSHTKQSLTSIMSDFGKVEEVELLGSKGNAALVTFADEKSCKPCVDAYRTSETMRATFLGRKKMDDSRHDVVPDQEEAVGSQPSNEDPSERSLRRAAERERLMRQMEMEESGSVGDNNSKEAQVGDRWESGQAKSAASFPPDLPRMSGDEKLTPFQILEKYERIIFDSIDQILPKK